MRGWLVVMAGLMGCSTEERIERCMALHPLEDESDLFTDGVAKETREAALAELANECNSYGDAWEPEDFMSRDAAVCVAQVYGVDDPDTVELDYEPGPGVMWAAYERGDAFVMFDARTGDDVQSDEDTGTVTSGCRTVDASVKCGSTTWDTGAN